MLNISKYSILPYARSKKILSLNNGSLYKRHVTLTSAVIFGHVYGSSYNVISLFANTKYLSSGLIHCLNLFLLNPVSKLSKFIYIYYSMRILQHLVHFYILSCILPNRINDKVFFASNFFNYWLTGNLLGNVLVSDLEKFRSDFGIFKSHNYSNLQIQEFKDAFSNEYRYIYRVALPMYIKKCQESSNAESINSTTILPLDKVYSDKNLNFRVFFYKFINKLVKGGKKSLATKHFLSFLYFHKLNNLLTGKKYIFGEVIDVISPKFKLVNLKYRGRNRQVPKLVSYKKAIHLGISIFIQSLSSRKEKGVVLKMFNEVLDIYSLKGHSFKLKEANYKLGIANRYLLFRKANNWRARKVYDFDKSMYYLG